MGSTGRDGAGHDEVGPAKPVVADSVVVKPESAKMEKARSVVDETRYDDDSTMGELGRRQN